MRKILNYLLGEDAVSEQNDREIREAFAGLAMAWIFFAMLYITLCIFG